MKLLFSNIYAKHFLLEVKFGCGHESFTKIKTADIERIMCTTVVTFKKKHTVGEGKISFGRYARPGIEINLHNITMYEM